MLHKKLFMLLSSASAFSCQSHFAIQSLAQTHSIQFDNQCTLGKLGPEMFPQMVPSVQFLG